MKKTLLTVLLFSLPAIAQQRDCSKITSKFWRGLCEAGQAANPQPAQPAQPAGENAQLTQDAIAGKIPCNDPRALALPVNRGHSIGTDVSDKDANFIACVIARLVRSRVTLPPGRNQTWGLAIVHKTQINSVTMPLSNGHLLVMAYDSMAQFVNYDPDEEAFIIGHEIGHVQDWQNCQNIRTQRVNQAIILKQHALTKAQQVCEENADFYGLQFAWGAGFNPYAAGALMGRLEMYLPDQTTGLGAMLNNFTSDHPISPERTKKLRERMIELCSKPGTACRP